MKSIGAASAEPVHLIQSPGIQHTCKKARAKCPGLGCLRSCRRNCCLCGWQLRRLHGDEASALSLVLKLDLPGDLGKESVVAAAADIQPRLQFCPALTHDDGASRYDLPGKPLHAQPLCRGVTPVAAGRRTLFFEPEGAGFVRLTVIDGRGVTDSVVVRLQ